MSDPKITIKFRADGAAALKKAIVELSVAQKRLEKGNAAAERMQKKLNRQIDEYNQLGIFGVRNTRNLSFSLSVLRSRLLIAAFGFATLNKTVGSFVRAQGEQELAEKKLEQALGKVNKGLLGQASALQKVTAFGDETIISAQALLAAFVKDEDQLKKATEATLDLAAAKGMDLASAADLVGKTLGSSTNSLKRYGIETEGAVGSTERLDTLVNNIANVFGGQAKAQAETLTGSIQQMKNAIGDTAESIGLLLSPAVISVAKTLKEAANDVTEFFKSLTETRLETTIRHLEELGDSSKAFIRLKGLQIDRDIKKLNQELALVNKTGLNAEQIESRLIAMRDERISLEHELNAIHENTTEEFRNQIKLEMSINDLTLGALKYSNDAAKAQEVLAEHSKNKLKLESQIGITQEKALDALNREELGLAEVASILSEILILESQRIDLKTDDNDDDNLKILKDTEKISKLKFESKMREIVMEKKLQTSMTATASQAMKSAGTIKNAHKDILNAMVKEYVARQSLIIADAIASAFKTVPYPFNFVAAAGAGTAAGALLNSLAPKFETGGLVGGRRHSQGGTLIEAERGEFVMSRNAVESIGADNLEAMNQGGGAVNITITGNVMTSDFVEGELADKIRDAVRTGTDFGMS